MARPLALALLLLALTVCCPGAQGGDNGAPDCCLAYTQQIVRLNIVRSYRQQDTNGGCTIPAVIFSPKNPKRKDICADPSMPWVRELLRKLDRFPKGSCGKNRSQGQTCRRETLACPDPGPAGRR
uniref:Chemokine interleukin-8-like domain-containing protein n=1 Tax=Ornithorhynchus anatinus TaxID=9258 RepID=K7EGD3_ORNAN